MPPPVLPAQAPISIRSSRDRPRDFRPLVKVCSRVSGGGDNRAYLESGLLESLSEAGVLIGHHYGDHNDRYQDNAEIPADFFNRKCFLEFFLKDQIVGAEVNTKEDHGDGHYYLQVYGIAGHTVVFDPESSGSAEPKVMVRVSKRGMPPTSRKMISIMVIPR